MEDVQGKKYPYISQNTILVTHYINMLEWKKSLEILNPLRKIAKYQLLPHILPAQHLEAIVGWYFSYKAVLSITINISIMFFLFSANYLGVCISNIVKVISMDEQTWICCGSSIELDSSPNLLNIIFRKELFSSLFWRMKTESQRG